jgi:hypothetical protein
MYPYKKYWGWWTTWAWFYCYSIVNNPELTGEIKFESSMRKLSIEWKGVDWLCFTSNIWKHRGKWERRPQGIHPGKIDSTVTCFLCRLSCLMVPGWHADSSRPDATSFCCCEDKGVHTDCCVLPHPILPPAEPSGFCLFLAVLISSVSALCLLPLSPGTFPDVLASLYGLSYVSVLTGKTWSFVAILSLFSNLLPYFHCI